MDYIITISALQKGSRFKFYLFHVAHYKSDEVSEEDVSPDNEFVNFEEV